MEIQACGSRSVHGRVVPNSIVFEMQAGNTYQNPPSMDAKELFARGGAYYREGEFDKALADYSMAIWLNPKFAEAYYSRGLTYQKKGEKAKADEDFAQAKKLGYKAQPNLPKQGPSYPRPMPPVPEDKGGLFPKSPYNDAYLKDTKPMRAFLTEDGRQKLLGKEGPLEKNILSRFKRDRHGILRDAFGNPVGIWGVDGPTWEEHQGANQLTR